MRTNRPWLSEFPRTVPVPDSASGKLSAYMPTSPYKLLVDGGEWLCYKPAHELDVGVAAPIATLLSSLRVA